MLFRSGSFNWFSCESLLAAGQATLFMSSSGANEGASSSEDTGGTSRNEASSSSVGTFSFTEDRMLFRSGSFNWFSCESLLAAGQATLFMSSSGANEGASSSEDTGGTSRNEASSSSVGTFSLCSKSKKKDGDCYCYGC
ncbi:unnamed protein product [Coffea canephora]|uniref:DH200=94 genomic scaffold, scaffold_214 n=1 Tax=Coffea canephora TaxID=49390 RepID=A0A068VC49_COFCA|nr:unnamed protein product [Coffea canephora]